ncbi:hypothetical protein Bca4012_102908 [Brassica carinata]
MNVARMSGDWIASVCRLCAHKHPTTDQLSFSGQSGAFDFIVRGEILGFMKDEQLRKHLPRMFSLIKNESWGLKTIRYRPSLNHKRCRPGSADVAFRTPLAPYEKSKFLGSGGSMVARLKLKGIDGRAPPGVEPAA